MQKQSVKIWISKKIIKQMMREAKKSYPKESGGVLMGYHVKNGDIVLTSIIKSGPNAKHSTHSFVPDYAFQENEIASIYKKSRRFHTYLGDWHIHPNGKPYLSLKDKSALVAIAQYPEARMSKPIMIILGGSYDGWSFKIWQLTLKKMYLGLARKKEIIEIGKINYY